MFHLTHALLAALALHSDAPAPCPEPAPAPADETPAIEGLDVALQLEKAYRGIADHVFPSVVSIAAYNRAPEGEGAEDVPQVEATWRLELMHEYPGFELNGSGSGVVLSEDGYILTNRHYLLKEDGTLADLIDVETVDNRHTISRIVGMEPTLNMAILKLEVYAETNKPRFTPIRFGNSFDMLPGSMTLAVADPYGPEKYFGPGVFAATPSRECYQEQLTATFLQAAMRVHPGAYGGALVNLRGEFVGMLTPRNPKFGLASSEEQHLAIEFALPSNIIAGLYQTILRNETFVSPWLGYAVMSLAELQKELGTEAFLELDRPRVGIYIENVFDPSPAHAAGIQPGDFLVKFDGHFIGSPLDFQKYLYMAGIGNTVEVELYRAGETYTRELLIEERPENAVTR
jgi:serine protease Do